MRNWPLILSAALLTSLLFSTNNAFAISLSDLFGGDSITVGDKTFTNWTSVTNTITGSEARAGVGFNTANIDVTGDASDPSNPRLVFTPSSNELTILQAGNIGVVANLDFRYDVTVGAGPTWHDSSLVANYTETVLGSGNDHQVHAHTELFTDFTLSTKFFPDGPDTHLIRDDSIPLAIDLSGVTETVFFTPRSSGTVLKELTWLTDSDTESVGISGLTQGFSQIPEPSTFALGLMGLLSLGMLGSRRRRR